MAVVKVEGAVKNEETSTRDDNDSHVSRDEEIQNVGTPEGIAEPLVEGVSADKVIEIQEHESSKDEEMHESSKEKKHENSKEEKNANKEASASNKKVKKTRKRASKGKKSSEKASGAETTAKSNSGEEPSKNNTKERKFGGMIFMCNSQTKKDCFSYRVLGLPETKRDAVFKIRHGMALFLYDIDMKLLYGIYRAAGPGGYNIQPKAFNSKFPSQVRFTVHEDCVPMPEEKLRKIIKENYRNRGRFDTELTKEQVNNLCKAFRVAKPSRRRESFSSPIQRAPPPRVPARHAYPVVDEYANDIRDGYERPPAYAIPLPPAYAQKAIMEADSYERMQRPYYVDQGGHEFVDRDQYAAVYRDRPAYSDAAYPVQRAPEYGPPALVSLPPDYLPLRSVYPY